MKLKKGRETIQVSQATYRIFKNTYARAGYTVVEEKSGFGASVPNMNSESKSNLEQNPPSIPDIKSYGKKAGDK